MNNIKKPQYEPPRARDLSALSVSGQGPAGACFNGYALTSGECRDGTAPVGGTCYPNGVSPDIGYCTIGNVAVEGCFPTGAIHH